MNIYIDNRVIYIYIYKFGIGRYIYKSEELYYLY